MSAALSPSSRGVILDQLQSDAPQSPLVGHLRSRLSLVDDAATPSSSSSVGPSIPSGSEPKEKVSAAAAAAPGASQIEGPHPPSNFHGAAAAASEEGTRVKTHSHRPISADFLISGSGSSTAAALQSRDSAGNANAGGLSGPSEGAESKRESIRKSASSSGRPESYVLVHNVAKRHNLGTLARSATAFGVTELILVGRKDFNAFGSHGASLHIQFRHFHTLPEAALYLKAKDVDICGVEIIAGATAVHKHPFTRSTAFVLGNEGTGLSKKEMDICSFFVYIPQCGFGTASLNVTVAASIVLHHFSVWAGFAERERDGQKFVVAERPVRRTHRNTVEDPEALMERRRQKAECGSDDWLFCDGEDENDSNELIDGREIGTIEFPNSKKSGLLSSLNSLYK